MIVKTFVVCSLLAVARVVNRPAAALARAWAHARLAARIATPLDPSVVILGTPEIHGTGQIRFGRDLYLYRDLYLETQEAGRIAIGDGVVVSRGVHIVSFSAITVGDGSMIGEYTSVRDANHRTGAGSLRHSGHDSAPIVIGKNVWIGRGVTILPGVTIGDNAIVGANAVVTRNIAAGTVAVGVPAKPMLKTGAA
jgi:acetyltransferase-like isoleucine patch superfamily enzyme